MDNYESLKKNTVEAYGQLKESERIRFYNPKGQGKRIMFIGNSITLHGKKPEIGWHFEHGMAASAPKKDYVHILMDKISNTTPDCAFCICQAAEWERNFAIGEKVLSAFESAREFNADALVFRIAENCAAKDFSKELFKTQATKLIEFLNPSGEAEVLFTTSFWYHPADAAIEELAEEMHSPLVLLGDLGEKDEMKAVGLFEHGGVAMHPGDLGMKSIAERIFEKMKNML